MSTTLPQIVPPPHAAPPPVGDSFASRLALLLLVVLGCVYLLNPTAGLFELLPDNLPLIGNLDEAGATALVIWAGRKLFLRRRV